MQYKTSSSFLMTVTGLVSLFATACGSLEPLKKETPQSDGPIKLDRPSYSKRPYRKETAPAPQPYTEPYSEEAATVQPYREEAPQPYKEDKPVTQTLQQPIPSLEPVPYRVNGNLVSPDMFLTPDDLSLPTENQVSDGL